MPGGTGPVNATMLSACAARDRAISTPDNANEIFFNLDSRRVYYDGGAGQLYFVDAPNDPVLRTVETVLGGMRAGMVVEQLHLDSHRFFNGARRIALSRGQAGAVLVALRLAGIRATIR